MAILGSLVFTALPTSKTQSLSLSLRYFCIHMSWSSEQFEAIISSSCSLSWSISVSPPSHTPSFSLCICTDASSMHAVERVALRSWGEGEQVLLEKQGTCKLSSSQLCTCSPSPTWTPHLVGLPCARRRSSLARSLEGWFSLHLPFLHQLIAIHTTVNSLVGLTSFVRDSDLCIYTCLHRVQLHAI